VLASNEKPSLSSGHDYAFGADNEALFQHFIERTSQRRDSEKTTASEKYDRHGAFWKRKSSSHERHRLFCFS
jgi:hypothetical protein